MNKVIPLISPPSLLDAFIGRCIERFEDEAQDKVKAVMVSDKLHLLMKEKRSKFIGLAFAHGLRPDRSHTMVLRSVSGKAQGFKFSLSHFR